MPSRATGCNGNMARAQGINTNFIKVLALMISNGLVGLCGALYGQFQGAADVNMGRGAIVIGLAAVTSVRFSSVSLPARESLRSLYPGSGYSGRCDLLYGISVRTVAEDAFRGYEIVLRYRSCHFPGNSLLEGEENTSERSVKVMAYALEIQDVHKVIYRGTINEKDGLEWSKLKSESRGFRDDHWW